MKKFRLFISAVLAAALCAVCAAPAYAVQTARFESANTGDDANIGLLIALLCLSAAAIAGIIIYVNVSKKKKAAQQTGDEMEAKTEESAAAKPDVKEEKNAEAKSEDESAKPDDKAGETEK